MSSKVSFFKTLFFFIYRIIFRQFLLKNPKGFRRSVSNANAYGTQYGKYQKYPSLHHRSDLQNKTLVFSVEGALLKSSSLFPYFMLVAFEAGSLLRSLILFTLYPVICLVGEEMGLKIMVMVSFFGIKKNSFRVGTAVLPKFFLENVGYEMFEVLKRGGKRVGVSDMPQVMIESFLKDYLEIDHVVGREVKDFCGYFVGIMEERNKDFIFAKEDLGEEKKIHASDVIAIGCSNKPLDNMLFLQSEEIYSVTAADKRSWQLLPRDKYPKPLIFHDGRLALTPTPLDSLSLFMWIPLGFPLAIIRAVIALNLPYDISIPMLTFLGLRLTVSKPENDSYHSLLTNSRLKVKKSKHLLYVCNHRTLLDPLYLAFTLKKNLTAVTYSLSRMSEILSPITTVRLTRNRDQDGEMMERVLNQGDLAVCPEGTTCREPYLLRYSPLFAEMSDYIVPVANDTYVTMFHGTTAGGLKCLDPLFFLLNPSPCYTVRLLEAVSGSSMCRNDGDGRSRYDVANYVQNEVGKALGFECTKLTRRDKYQILAGNDGLT